MAMDQFLKLEARERALILIAVLLDGMEAEVYLESESNYKQHASTFAKMQAELRMPLVGSLLRKALTEIRRT